MMLPAHSNDAISSLVLPDQTCQRLTLAEIQSATHNFDDTLVIGHGGFGKVYKCSMTMGSVVREVAIKRLDSMSDQGATEFEAEVKLLSKLRHGNLVSLIGYCNEEKEMVLVYEFMPNGTIRDHLRKSGCGLSWSRRLKICIGAARALDYLHTGAATKVGIIHRDVKTSNILLDAEFAAKVSDFGLAKVGPINQTRSHVSTEVRGSRGYLDPCYISSYKLTTKSDVYAFGVVMFEVLSGKEALFSNPDEDHWTLSDWAQDQMKKGKLDKLVDSRLKGQISSKSLKKYARTAGRCLQYERDQRPTMAEVVVKLESILSQERESLDSVVDDETFIYKLKSIFTSKADLIPGGIMQKNLKIFTYAELATATNNFSDMEHHPTSNNLIYIGWVDERTYTPSKRGVGLAMYVTKKHVNTSELDLPENFDHPNLSKVLGYYLELHTLFCVYELISDARLDKLLYGEKGGTPLSWDARKKIALGAAQGLSFLHQLRSNRPAYSQFRTSCILVDENFNARLSDFEVDCSFISDRSYSFRNGNTKYAAPEWFRYQADLFDGIGIMFQGHLMDGFGLKSESYSFGVVLLEILTGMKVFDENRPDGKQNLVNWVTPLLKDEVDLGRIVDPLLAHDTCPKKGVFKLAMLISNCLQANLENRPYMKEVVQVLAECYHENEGD